MIADRDVTVQLYDALRSLIDDDTRRQRMIEASRAMGKPDAGRNIAKRILELIHERETDV